MRKREVGIVGLAMVGLVVVAALLYAVFNTPIVAPVARSYEDMGWLRVESVTLTATGAAGAATGSASTGREINGYVYAVHLDWTSGISATTDITLTQASPALTMLQVSNTYTDTWYYPVVGQHTSAGASSSTYEKALVGDQVDIAVGETTSGTVGTATLYWGQ